MNSLNKSQRRYVLLSILVTVVIILFGSCKKALNQGPIDSVYSGNFWTSQANVEQASQAMYSQLRSNLNITGISNEGYYFVTGDLVSSNFTIAGGSYDQFLTQFLPTGQFNFNYVPYWGNLQDWSRFYTTIALCNEVLVQVAKMRTSLFSGGVTQQNAYLAEAYFVRAYTYFYMCEVWGDPVYVAKTFDDVNYGHIPPVARSSTNSVLDSCLNDLRFAQSYLNYSGGDPSQTIRANKGSVQALMANMFAWQHNYDSAHYYCQQVINNGGYALESMETYQNIWAGMSSSESIFELPMLYNVNDPNFKSEGTDGSTTNSNAEASFNFFATFLKGTIVNNLKSQSWLVPLGGIMIPGPSGTVVNNLGYSLFDTVNDQRFKSVFSYQPASGGDAAGYMLTKYTSFAYAQPSGNPNVPGSYPYVNNDLVLMRLADIYLLDAEALAYKGDLNDAIQELSRTETRAGIDTYRHINSLPAALDSIVAEQGRESIGEGKWFYTLIRTDTTQHWLEQLGYASQRVKMQGYYWPLNMATLFPYDNLLTQNPWWATQNQNQ